MKHQHSLRLVFHAIALFIEAVGTGFIFLDTLRLNARLPPEGTYLEDPAAYQAWYFHAGVFGFFLLFAGMLFAALVLFLEHRAFLESNTPSHTPKPPDQSPPTARS